MIALIQVHEFAKVFTCSGNTVGSLVSKSANILQQQLEKSSLADI